MGVIPVTTAFESNNGVVVGVVVVVAMVLTLEALTGVIPVITVFDGKVISDGGV